MSHQQGDPPSFIGPTTGPDPDSSREATPNLLRGPQTDPPTAIHTPTFNLDSRVNSTGSLLNHVNTAVKAGPVDPSHQPVAQPSFTFNGDVGQVDPDQAHTQADPTQIQATGPSGLLPEQGVWPGRVTGDPRIQLWLQSVPPHPYVAPTLGPHPYGPPPLQVPADYIPYMTAPTSHSHPDNNVHQQPPRPRDQLPYDQPAQPHYRPSQPHNHLPRPHDCLPSLHTHLPAPHDQLPPLHTHFPRPYSHNPQPHAHLPQHYNQPEPIPIQPAFGGSSFGHHLSQTPHSSPNVTSADYRVLEQEIARLLEQKNRLQVQCGHMAQEVEGWKTRAAEVPVLQERLAVIGRRLGAADDFTDSALAANRASLASKNREIERLATLVSEQEAVIERMKNHHARTLEIHAKERMGIKDEDLTDAARKRRRAGAQAGAASSGGGRGRESGGGDGGYSGDGGGNGMDGNVKPVV